MSSLTLKSLFRIQRYQLKTACDVLARSFKDDPLFSYFIPDATKRLKLLPSIFAVSLNRGMRHGEVYATSQDLEGIAIWLPSEKAEINFGEIVRHGKITSFLGLGMRSLYRIWLAGRFIMGVRRRCAPPRYCYLSPIGIDPGFQGKGYASKLIRPMLDRLERERLPCYLETQNKKNVVIYQHYGFRVIEETAILSTGVRHWAMLR